MQDVRNWARGIGQLDQRIVGQALIDCFDGIAAVEGKLAALEAKVAKDKKAKED